MNQATGKTSTLVELLSKRALRQPDLRLFTYLIDGEIEGPSLTLAELDSQARVVGAALQSRGAHGARALLLYPPGLEFITAFFGCLYAGAIAVPLPAPNMAQPQRTLPRLRTVANDAQPMFALTTSAILSRVDKLFSQAPELQSVRWIATDKIVTSAARDWHDPGATSKTTALLQYTSGSTADPRGVIVSHGNLLANSAHISHAFEITPDTVSVTWLPAFHDMGLTNGIVQPVFGGRRCILMPPQSFLQRPLRWLQAISHYRASISGGPNFAYELCVSKVTPEQRSALDLRNWKVAYNGAEPIRAASLERFTDTFHSCGFRSKFFYPCYGLAEATLIVSGGLMEDEPVRCTTQVAALEHNRVIGTSPNQSNVRTLIGCGHAMPDTRIVIVRPETLIPCESDEIGEIWVSAPNVADGYWNRIDETELTFCARLANTGEGPFLRTGDLGFLKEGELFVTGRLKDLIIIGGRNLYPHDIESTVAQSHAAIRHGSCVAFSADVADQERLIIVVEVERRYQCADDYRYSAEPNSVNCVRADRNSLSESVSRAIRRAVAEEHDVRVHAVVLMRAGSVPKTPSGKVQRRVCEARFRDGTLEQRAATE